MVKKYIYFAHVAHSKIIIVEINRKNNLYVAQKCVSIECDITGTLRECHCAIKVAKQL